MARLGLTGASWNAWRIIGKVVDGLPLAPEEMVIYTQVTGRTTVPTDLRELWALAGRGSGKTTFAAVQAIKFACRGYANVRGITRVLLLAFVKEQAGVAFEICSEMFDQDRELRKLISGRTKTELTLAHGVRIQTLASSWRSLRSYSVAFALLDEVCFWWNAETNANEDKEILRSLGPTLGKVAASGAKTLLLAASTPWTEEGELFDVHQRYYGKDDSSNILVVQAATTVLRPSFDAATIRVAEERDPESAASEYGAAWRVAGGTLVRPPAYDACVSTGVFERAPEDPLGDDYFTAAVDLSGGMGQDSAALTIGHVEEADGPDVFTQDLLVEVTPPFDPGSMVAEFAGHCRRYGITEVIGDQFSAGFAAAEFRRHGITYTVSARKSAECVLDSLAILNTRRARLLDVLKARKQWLNLKRDYASGGRPTILERGGKHHDDLAVVTARGIVAALGLGEEEVVRIAAVFG
jgi:hypothetical protein